MAAPSETVWGSIVTGSKDGRQGKLGIYTSVSNTDTQTTVNVQVWFWTIYTCTDSSNTLYYDAGTGVTAASTSQGSVTINHTVNSGSGWSETNQTRLLNKTYTYTRGTSAATYKVYAKLSNIDMLAGTVYANTTYTVPALASYTVSYNANGGSGAPSSQTKWYGKSLTLSSTKPTRTGYSFQGWATSASGSVAYAAGESYTANAAVTLYAVWEADTYTVTYNANGGTGAPASQTKTYGVTLTLSSTKPTRTNYNFQGWATSASATTATYAAGGSYTANTAVTLYAVWELAYKKPTISNLFATRCDSSGNLADDGTYALLTFKWSSFLDVTSVKAAWIDATGATSGSATISASGTSGTVSQVIGSGSFDTEVSYAFTVTVTDSNDSTDRSTTMSGMEFHVDFGENSVAIGKPAETLVDENGETVKAFDVDWLAKFRKHVCVGDKIGYHDGKQGIFMSYEGFMHLQRTTAQGYHPYIGFYLDDATSSNGVIRVNSSTLFMEFLNAAGYHFDSDIYMNNNEAIMGYDSSGAAYNAFQAKNESNNTIVGYSNYANASGNTNIYGYDINFGVANLADPGSYRPYRRKGDSVTFSIRTAGYVTNSGQDVSFYVPFSMPIIGSPTVTVTSGNGFTLRQGNSYTHGSSASAYAKPASYSATLSMYLGVYITASFSDTTNVTNNDTIGIYWNGTITFS